jgi:hypothetical protein
MSRRRFKIGDIVTIKHGLSTEYIHSFRVDAGKRCKVAGYTNYGAVRIKILEPTKKRLCRSADYHWCTAEETLEPLKNQQLTFIFTE